LTNLPSLDLTALPSFYSDSEAASGTRDAAAGLGSDRTMLRKVRKRAMIDATKFTNACKAITRLPKKGEALTIVMSGQEDGWDFALAIVHLLGVKVESLYLTSLGFNERVITGLLDLLDTGKVAKVAMLTSVYFMSVDGKLYDQLHAELMNRGQRLAARRNHSKLMLFAAEDGRRLVLESSANLRSCRNVEVATLSNDAALHDFHKGWIEELFTKKGK
jgi:hypothetical protein